MSNSLAETYKKISQVQHVLLRPDTYVGSMDALKQTQWVVEAHDGSLEGLTAGSARIVPQKIELRPGLYKLVDEILVNAADNYQRDKKMTRIEVKITKKHIEVLNDGKSIPNEIHPDHDIYVTELIFGQLLTSSNFSDSMKKLTGGRNGFGGKLANMFSKEFIVETGDAKNKTKLIKRWTQNMSKSDKVQLKPYSGKDYTKVWFQPDFARFGEKNFPDDMMGLLARRVYDLAGILPISVKLNGNELPVGSFVDYAKLYVGSKALIEDPSNSRNNRWKVVVAESEGQFQQFSFVNAIYTSKGGTHVDHVVDQIVEGILGIIKKKNKNVTLKPFQVKAYLRVFINAFIENPTFNSQCKETLVLNEKSFGSSYTLSNGLLNEIEKSGIVDTILSSVRTKENTKIEKELKKFKNVRLILPKLQDANKAGISPNCTLILTEGDSAKALAMAGIEKLGRDLYGVFPLRGKIPNVKELTAKQIMKNNELSSIVKILGLNFNHIYVDTKPLRYSSVMIMTDQDGDGSHIKGLIINFFASFWPSLCQIPGFLKQFITPLIRCRSRETVEDFYSQTDFNAWQQRVRNINEWKIKYYKGLGTSTGAEAKEYFSKLNIHQITFNYQDEGDEKAIDLAFGKKNFDARKKWLTEYDPLSNVDFTVKNLKVEDFVHKELIHFSIADNIRSIASLIDGLKPSQRKILFACFKRNLRQQIKVAQLAGYVAEHSAYHHGEQSLSATIVGMAQNFIGANNINLLEPIGQFGTRHMNGKDSAEPRYIFTCLSPMVRLLFPEQDDHILNYRQEDNMTIEPDNYIPILPLVLINGCEGIGTGWSTTVCPHKVYDVLEAIRQKVAREERTEEAVSGLSIGWQGFQGSIQATQKGSFIVKGSHQTSPDGLITTITEIPPRTSIRDFKSTIEELMVPPQDNHQEQPAVAGLKEYHNGENIHFQIEWNDGYELSGTDLEKTLGLCSNYSSKNMHLFDRNGRIKNYRSTEEIIEQFYQVRIEAYKKRKAYLSAALQRDAELLKNKITFLEAVLQGKFKMMDNKENWIKQMPQLGIKPIEQLPASKSTKNPHLHKENEEGYNYLLSMSIFSLCLDKVEELKANYKQVASDLRQLQAMTEREMWLEDLNKFEKGWEIIQQTKARTESKVSKPSAIGKRPPTQSLQLTLGRKKRKSEKENPITIATSPLSKEKKSSVVYQLSKEDPQKGATPKTGSGTIEIIRDRISETTSLIDKYLQAGEGSLAQRIKARIDSGGKQPKSVFEQGKKQEESKVLDDEVQKALDKEVEAALGFAQDHLIRMQPCE